MKLNTKIEIEEFRRVVDQAKGDVYLRSQMGDQYNLKSTLSEYVAIGRMIEDYSGELELFCSEKCDEPLFYKFLEDHPDVY